MWFHSGPLDCKYFIVIEACCAYSKALRTYIYLCELAGNHLYESYHTPTGTYAVAGIL